MKVVAVTPNWDLYKGLTSTDTLRPPKSAALEWLYLRRDVAQATEDLDLTIADEYRGQRSIADFIDYVRSSVRPTVCLLSTTPSYLFWRCPPPGLSLVKRYVAALRTAAPDSKIVLVGPHATVTPDTVIRSTGADFAFRGEIDSALLTSISLLQRSQDAEFVASLVSLGSIAPELPLSGAPVSYTREDLARTEPHTWLPSASRDLLHADGYGYALLESSRGCSFDCGFCLRAGFRRKLRLKPPETFAAEVESLRRMGAAYAFLLDETFGLPRSHAREIMWILHDADLPYGAQTRPDIWREEDLELLRKTGCVYLEVGTESLTDRGIAALGKFGDAAGMKAATNRIKERIPYVGVNILDVGNPDLRLMTPKDAVNERDNEGRLPPAYTPYPGTPWGQRALTNAGLIETWDDAALLYATYSVMSRNSVIGSLMRRSQALRRIVMCGLRVVQRLGVDAGVQTRFERYKESQRGAR